MVDMYLPNVSMVLAGMPWEWLSPRTYKYGFGNAWDRQWELGVSQVAGTGERRAALIYDSEPTVDARAMAFVRENGQAVAPPDFTGTGTYKMAWRVRVLFGQSGLPITFRTNYTNQMHDATLKHIPGVPPRRFIIQYSDDPAQMVFVRLEYHTAYNRSQRAALMEINGVTHAVVVIHGFPGFWSLVGPPPVPPIQGITLNHGLVVHFAAPLRRWPETRELLVLVLFIPVRFS